MVLRVIRLLLSEVRFARGRAIALGAGMLVTAVAFCLLTASVDVGLARINGVVGSNWRGSYDLLVLPAASAQTSGGSQHLVQLNYLSAEAGGISVSQAAQVARLPGVAVAAPLAVVGYVLETATLPVNISSVAGSGGAEVFTVTSSFTADHGLSRYPTQDDGYVYVTPDPVSPFQLGPGQVGPVEHLPDGQSVTVCPTVFPNNFVSSPFQRDAQATQGQNCDSRSGQTGTIQGTVEWSFPVLIAGIDPLAENELNGLESAVTSGRYLGEAERPSTVGTSLVVPVLGSTASFDGDVDHVTVNQLPASAVGVARSGKTPDALLRAMEAEPATPVLRDTISSSQAWQALLSQLGVAVNTEDTEFAQIVSQYWSAGPVTYRGTAPARLEPAAVANPAIMWTSGISVNGSGYVPAPPAAADTSFRVLDEHLAFGGSNRTTTLIHSVGEFDPYKLAGFSGAGPGSSLASYRAPLLTGADAATVAALGNQPLQPDGNLAGYAQQPPVLLTNLAGVAALEDPGAFEGTATQAEAPIGSIRVRVADLHGPVQQQLQKIAAVGQEIRTATGLHVIVTAGASPEPVTISLPAGAFGRPPLRLSEQWTAVMVALVVLQQADRESLALFALILVVCGLFLGEAALAGVRARRREIGVLRALGWGRRQVFVLVLGEVTVLGLLAGVIGAAISVLLIEGLRLSLPLWRAALVLPVAVVLATISGLIPAWLAARAEPTEALAPAARAPHRAGFAVRSIRGLAVTGVARVPGRSALAAIGLGVGVAALTVLLAAQASFSSSIGDSALAGLVTATTRGTDVISAVLAVGLGAAAVADVTYLNLRERAGELAALAASGWGQREIATLLGVEALVTAVVGSTAGAALGLVAAAAAFGLTVPVVAAAVAAAAGGILIAVAGTALILAFASDRPLAEVLAADE